MHPELLPRSLLHWGRQQMGKEVGDDSGWFLGFFGGEGNGELTRLHSDVIYYDAF